ncbi:5524_t:CDS:2 [Paraglomus brasilianum]|uniref:5524_t:CDS:1 n=1 Tax=Paraglomus brasilianum TaxID=144538 RepID=A0A9N8VVM0_9GLOM|nr:5524_t:CDS:2 [Paraglomus brasilianum]
MIINWIFDYHAPVHEFVNSCPTTPSITFEVLYESASVEPPPLKRAISDLSGESILIFACTFRRVKRVSPTADSHHIHIIGINYVGQRTLETGSDYREKAS